MSFWSSRKQRKSKTVLDPGCSSKRYPYLRPTEGTFPLDPELPGISISGGAYQTPYPPEVPYFPNLVRHPAGKNSYVKNAVVLYYYARVNCFCDKERKNPFIHVNTVSYNLNFALEKSFLVNN